MLFKNLIALFVQFPSNFSMAEYAGMVDENGNLMITLDLFG